MYQTNLSFPLIDPLDRVDAVRQNKCPQCGTDLDTGWECTNYDECGYDASPIACIEVTARGRMPCPYCSEPVLHYQQWCYACQKKIKGI